MVGVMPFCSSTGSTLPVHRRLGAGQVVSGLLQMAEKRRQALMGSLHLQMLDEQLTKLQSLHRPLALTHLASGHTVALR
jgi:hypothetical protein